MIYNVYAIEDLKSTYLFPAVAISHAAAIRDFQLAYAQEGTPLHKFPEDFRLCCIGKYDNSIGKIESCPMEVIYDGKELKKVGE